MTLGRAQVAVIVACALAPGCDRLFALTHVPDPPGEAGTDAMVDAAPPCPATDISVGQRHACAIVPGGEVYCWGGNEFGEAQPGGTDHVLTPMRVPLPGAADEVVVGKNNSCARIGGDVYCWGINDSGNLGKGETDTSQSIRRLDFLQPSAHIAIGGGHMCSLDASDGTVWCWGRNRYGQTGQPASGGCGTEQCTLPAPVPGISGAKKLYAGHNATCVIDANDQAICWGRNRNGELGIGGSADVNSPTLVQVTPPIRSLDLAGIGLCAIDDMQRTWCSGQGELGQVGNGVFSSVTTPAQVFVTKPTQVATNAFGSCAITEDNSLACWGSVTAGDGVHGTYSTPHSSPVHDVTKLAGHYYAYCALANGGLVCWGNNNDGQLGRGSRGLVMVPQALALTSPTALAVGDEHGCAIASDGVRCWGNNAYGQTDPSSLVNAYTPTRVTVPVTTPLYLAAFNVRTCVWGSGQAACWGRGFGGSLGTGATNSGRSVPPLPVIRANVRNGNLSIGLGANHMCVIDDNMTVTCYGRNVEYEIGDGTNFDRPSGVTLTSLTSVDQVVAGRYHTCVRILANGGQMWCWGAGAKGQLGTGDNGVRGTPTNVAGIGTVMKIGAGEQHSCALNTSGQVYCWGWNLDGQVGNGQTQDVMTPTPVVSSGATDLVVGVRSTCAKIGISDWKCWGRNAVGQLATGNDVNLLVPTTIQAFAGAATIAPGNDQACMLTASTVSCAGRLAAIGTGANSELFPQAPKLPSCQ